MNTQDKVASVELKKCVKLPTKHCYQLKQKWSYAIPLELIYMTPLYKWNPFDLMHHGDQTSKNLKIVNEGGKRNGDCSGGDAKAFNGINSRIFYQTPASFYSGRSVGDSSAADTARGVTCVLDQSGKARQVRSSGTHVFLPQICWYFEDQISNLPSARRRFFGLERIECSQRGHNECEDVGTHVLGKCRLEIGL